jgi:hypothetical protein
MKKINNVFAISLVAVTVSLCSMSIAIAHTGAGDCTHKHYITNLDGSDNHTSGSTLRRPSFDGITSCTTNDGSAGTCKNKTFSGESQKRATCVKNSTSLSKHFSTLSFGRSRIRMPFPKYENPLRTQTPKSEKVESTQTRTPRSENIKPTPTQTPSLGYSVATPRFRTYGLR